MNRSPSNRCAAGVAALAIGALASICHAQVPALPKFFVWNYHEPVTLSASDCLVEMVRAELYDYTNNIVKDPEDVAADIMSAVYARTATGGDLASGSGHKLVLTFFPLGLDHPDCSNSSSPYYDSPINFSGRATSQAMATACMPGDNVQMEIDLMGKPIAMEKGLRFAVREGGRTIGSGGVTEIVE